MASIELKNSLCRILADLVKSDNVISVDEMDILEEAAKFYELTKECYVASYEISLAEAAVCLADQKMHVREKIVDLMENLALKDGECCREEALLISSIEIVNSGKGRILSMPLKNRPILPSQIVYVDSTYNPRKNDLDRNYEELRRIVEMAGLELIYIPRVAMDFKVMKKVKDLVRLISLVNPTLSERAFLNKTRALQDMDSRYFFLQVLNGKLQMGLTMQRPSWLIGLPNSVVSGNDYANYLCYDVNMDDIKGQLITFIEGLNRRQGPYVVHVNHHADQAKDFLYGGFHKALLDVIAADKVETWEVRVYTRAGRNPVIDLSEPGHKFSIEICKGDAKYPVLINGREAAFYLLLLCGSASSPQRGIDFDYERELSKKVQAQFVEAYHLVSNREKIPDITSSSTFRPIKTKVMKGLEECGIKGELHLFTPTKTGKNSYYIPINPENVTIISREGSTPLLESSIYKAYLKLLG